MPPVYPNGWYKLCRADELPIGGVKRIELLGLRLALFRGEDGKVGLLDAYVCLILRFINNSVLIWVRI